ncbi:MAG: hypothetical protein ABIA02_00730 [Candidatus Falkowbacteria bacterium]
MKKNDFEFNWPLVGNKQITEFLSRGIVNDKISGSYIFCGPDNLGKTTVANYFAKSLICENKEKKSGILPCGECQPCKQMQNGIHGDVHLIKKLDDKKNISIEQIRVFIRTLGMASFLNSYKIGIIKHAESLSIEASNALLKTLEEPKNKVVVILVVTNIDSLPETIVSRSQILKFNCVNSDIIYDYLINEHKAKRSLAKDLSHLCLGRPALAIKFLEDKEFLDNYLNQAQSFLNILKGDLNNGFLEVEKLIGVRATGQDASRSAKRILEVWQGITRDFLLLENNQDDLVQHLSFKDDMKKIKEKINAKTFMEFIKNLRRSEEYLNANVNPKLVLENVVISF